MRTYTRKRPEFQYIEGVHELCRLCLEKCEESVPIFENSNVCATLAMRIMICVGLEMAREDCLPNMICVQCYQELEKYYTFRKKCEVSYQKLKSHFHAVQERVNSALKDEQVHKDPLNDAIQNASDIDTSKLMLTFNEDQVAAVNMLNLNGEVVKENEDIKILIVKSEETSRKKSYDQQFKVPGQIESLPEQNQSPEITDFLSTILTDLGILGKQGDTFSVMDTNIKTLTLETGDGDEIDLELIEEDEQVKEPEEKPIVIKYITSNYIHSEGKAAIPNPTKVGSRPGSAWCGSCGMWLSSASALSRHKRLHSGERPHQCTVCLRRFAQKEVMLRHRLVHDEVRPFACSSCPKSFTQRGSLAAHARSHAPPHRRTLALHRCLRCPKVFLYASGLSRHMMMHNGRVYVCGACDRQFTDKSSLMRHLNVTKHATPASTTP